MFLTSVGAENYFNKLIFLLSRRKFAFEQVETLSGVVAKRLLQLGARLMTERSKPIMN